MKDRIKKIRKELDLTQQKFADRLGVQRNTIAMYEMGKTFPSDAIMRSISREFNVNEDWLRTGKGEMFIKQTRDEEIATFINSMQSCEDDSFKKRFISMLSTLDESEWEFLEKKAKELCAMDDVKEVSIYDQVPDTPEELERLFPPVEINDKSDVG